MSLSQRQQEMSELLVFIIEWGSKHSTTERIKRMTAKENECKNEEREKSGERPLKNNARAN